MAKSPSISAQVRQRLESAVEAEKRELVLRIDETITATPVGLLFDGGLVQGEVVQALNLHVEVFAERVFDLGRELVPIQPIQEAISETLDRVVSVLYNVSASSERFGFPQDAALKFRELQRRRSDLFLPTMLERLRASLESQVSEELGTPIERDARDGLRTEIHGFTSDGAILDENLSAHGRAAVRNKLEAVPSIVEAALLEVTSGATNMVVAAGKLEVEAYVWAQNYFHEILYQWSLKGIPPTRFESLALTKADEVANYAADHFCVDCTPDGTTEFTPFIIGTRPGVIASSAAPDISTRERIYEKLREALPSYPDQYRKENQFRYGATALPKPDEAPPGELAPIQTDGKAGAKLPRSRRLTEPTPEQIAIAEKLVSERPDVPTKTAAHWLPSTPAHILRLVRKGELIASNTNPRRITTESLRSYKWRRHEGKRPEGEA